VRPEGLGNLIKIIHLIGSQNRDLQVCNRSKLHKSCDTYILNYYSDYKAPQFSFNTIQLIFALYCSNLLFCRNFHCGFCCKICSQVVSTDTTVNHIYSRISTQYDLDDYDKAKMDGRCGMLAGNLKCIQNSGQNGKNTFESLCLCKH
jgi:hypothetical protein